VKDLKWIDRLTLLSLYSLALFSFTSTSASALSHIFIALPGIYYFSKQIIERSWQPTGSQLALLGMVITAAISIVIAPDIPNTLYRLTKLKYFLLGFTSIFAYQALLPKLESRQLRLLVTIFTIAITAASISGMVGLLTGYNPLRMKEAYEVKRATGMYSMSITYGNGILFAVIMYTGAFIWYPKFKSLINYKLLIFGWCTTITGLLLSFTRGAILAYLLSLPILLWYHSKIFFYYAAGAICLLLVALVVIIATQSTNKSHRLLQPLNSESNTVRISLYKSAWYAFTEHPLFGVGFRNFEKHSSPIKQRYNLPYPTSPGHAHNNLLEFLAGCGFFGFLSLLLFLIFWLKESWNRSDHWSPLMVTAVTGFFISGLVQSTIIDGENMFVVMFLYAISQISPATNS
jgi:O-antigen ligase